MKWSAPTLWEVFKPALPLIWTDVRNNWLMYVANGLVCVVTSQWFALFLLGMLPVWGALGHLSGRLEAQNEMRNRRTR